MQGVTYFEHTRKDIAPLLPERASRALEIGCGTGSTLAWLKTRYPGLATVGVEGNGELKDMLAKNVDQALIADLNKGVPELGQFDLILALDVLEHLTNADRTLVMLREMLTPDGVLIVSLPNVAYWAIGADLLVFGRFQYEEAGIMDRTHLRFFTAQSAGEMIQGAGLKLRGVLPVLVGRKNKLLNLLTLGLARRRLAKQIIFQAAR